MVGSSSLELTAGERWYVVYTLPHKEAYAEARLRAQGFRTFLPRQVRSTRHARKVRIVKTAVFPRYSFVILDLQRDRWRSVNGTCGVTSLLMADGEPIPAPAGVVEALISSTDEGGCLRFGNHLKPGQKVRLINSPFAEALGTLDRLDGRGRVEVLLNLMSGVIRAKLREEWVVPTA